MEPKQPLLFLIDDDKFLVDMYTMKFSKNGFTVEHAFDADEALKRLRDGFKPDIVLLDVIMPGMDGLDLLAEIRKEKLVPEAVVVMLTNQGLSNDIDRAKKLQVDGYIIKAMTIPSEVLTEVRNIYNQSVEFKSKQPPK